MDLERAQGLDLGTEEASEPIFLPWLTALVVGLFLWPNMGLDLWLSRLHIMTGKPDQFDPFV